MDTFYPLSNYTRLPDQFTKKINLGHLPDGRNRVVAASDEVCTKYSKVTHQTTVL
jgi:hypothetical protein